MSSEAVFRSARLTGRSPGEGVETLYVALFGDRGPRALISDRDAWAAGRIAPWVLAHAGHDVGVGGFRHWQDASALELIFHFLPDVWGQGLASEFVQAALDAASFGLQQTEFVATVAGEAEASAHILEKAGFKPTDVPDLMRLSLPPLAATRSRETP